MKKLFMNKGKNPTILIVDDEKINLLYLNAIVKRIDGYMPEILTAINGKEAIDICINNKIDLVLMDIRMPVMDGLEATREIKSFNPDIIVIVQTAFSTPQDKALAFDSGCNDFITKPINREELYSMIKNYI